MQIIGRKLVYKQNVLWKLKCSVVQMQEKGERNLLCCLKIYSIAKADLHVHVLQIIQMKTNKKPL